MDIWRGLYEKQTGGQRGNLVLFLRTQCCFLTLQRHPSFYFGREHHLPLEALHGDRLGAGIWLHPAFLAGGGGMLMEALEEPAYCYDW